MAVKAMDCITVVDYTDATNIKTWYITVSRTSSAPTVSPTATEAQMISNGWGTTEPAIDTSKKLYTVQQVLFGDSTYVWGDVSLSSAYEAAIEAYNKATAAQTTADSALSQSVEYINGTQTASTGSWTGVTTDSELKAGKTIAYRLPYAGNGNASLNLTLSGGGTTGAKAVYWNNTRVTTHYPQYSIIIMTYNGTDWRCSAYNSDTINRTRLQNVINAAAAITTGHIIVGTSAGYRDISSGIAFDITYPILYAGTTIAAGATTGTRDNNFLQINGINLATSVSGWTGTSGSTVYVVGTLSGNMFTVDSAVFTTTVPTTEDDKYYIPIGLMYSTTQCYFNSSFELYTYKDEQFGPASIREVLNAAKDIYGALELKIDSKNLISEINASADTIKIRGELVDFDVSKLVIRASQVKISDKYELGDTTNTIINYARFDGTVFESGVTYYEYNASGDTYTATSDTVPDEDKTYYYRIPFGSETFYEYIYSVFSSSSFEDGVTYYEYSNGEYIKTGDITKQSGKTYYTLSVEPTSDTTPQIGKTYYVLASAEDIIDTIPENISELTDDIGLATYESVTQISQVAADTASGLSVLQETMTTAIQPGLQQLDGVVNNTVIPGLVALQSQMVTIGQYSGVFDYITIDDGLNIYGVADKNIQPTKVSVKIMGDRIGFNRGDNEIAWIGAVEEGSEEYNLYIQKAQVIKAVQIGTMAFIPRTNGNMCLKYVGL